MLRKKFRKGQPYDAVTIPKISIENKIHPSPSETLWAFKNSKLIGTTHASKYSIEYGEEDETWSFRFFVKDSKLNEYEILFVSVPSDTKTDDLPMECHYEKLSTKSGLEKLLANIKKVDLPRKSPFEKIYTNDEMEKLLELIDYDDQAELSPSEVETLKRLMEQNYPVKFGRVKFKGVKRSGRNMVFVHDTISLL